jgi:hypothetical protein
MFGMWFPMSSPETIRRNLDEVGYYTIPRAVPSIKINGALRAIGLEIRRLGLTAEQIAEWQSGSFFPHLRWDDAIVNCRPDRLIHEVYGRVEHCDPQILIRLPDVRRQYDIVPHTDDEPPWAEGRKYLGIVSVALTDVDVHGGGTAVFNRAGTSEGWTLMHKAGDVTFMHPDLPHAGTPNLTATTRMALFFRVLEPRP